MDPSLGIDVRNFYTLGKGTQPLQSARPSSAALYNLHYCKKQFFLCLFPLTLGNIQTFCRNRFTVKFIPNLYIHIYTDIHIYIHISMHICIHIYIQFIYRKPRKTSTPGCVEVWIEFRDPFLSFFSLKGTRGQHSLSDLEITCVKQSCSDRHQCVKGTC